MADDINPMQWVSITDKYPPFDQTVLVTNGWDKFSLAMLTDDYTFIDVAECWDIDGVTHWLRIENPA